MQNMKLGDYIAIRRKKLHLTQEELSKRLEDQGVYRAASSIANWERGNQEVPISILPELARALDEPSVVMLYEYAGVLQNLPGHSVIKMLANASLDDIEMIEKIAALLLSKQHSQE